MTEMGVAIRIATLPSQPKTVCNTWLLLLITRKHGATQREEHRVRVSG